MRSVIIIIIVFEIVIVIMLMYFFANNSLERFRINSIVTTRLLSFVCTDFFRLFSVIKALEVLEPPFVCIGLNSMNNTCKYCLQLVLLLLFTVSFATKRINMSFPLIVFKHSL